jgi:hypothetical protein
MAVENPADEGDTRHHDSEADEVHSLTSVQAAYQTLGAA